MNLTSVNFLLVFAIGTTLMLTGMLLRQNVKLPIALVYAAILIFFTADIFTFAYTLNSGAIIPNLIAGNIHLFLGSILLAMLHYFTASFTYAKSLPRLRPINSLVFGCALVIGILAISGFFITGLQQRSGIYFPLYSNTYWLFILFGAVVTSLVFHEIYRRYKQSSHRIDVPFIREILWIIFPLMLISLFFIYVMPFFQVPQPIFYSGYPFIAGLLFFSAIRFQILEITEQNQYLLPQIMVSGFFLMIFYFSVDRQSGFTTLFLGIAFFLICSFLGYYTLALFTRSFKRVQIGYDERLDQKLEEFSARAVSCIDAQQLWNYLADFCHSTFDFSKIAVVTSPVNIPPYQVEFIRGFKTEAIHRFLQNHESAILERLGTENPLLNKFDISNKMPLYQALDRDDIYLGIPLYAQHEIHGFLFLGGERKYMPIPRRHVHFFKIIGTQTAIAIENIRSIEQMMQAQKMAGLGMLASQVAHDFRSFIALTKTMNRENPRLSKQATYMDKMVHDLLDYARPQDLKLSNVQINQLLDMTLDLIKIPPEICVKKQYGDTLPKLALDITQMRRVFSNIIENGIRSMVEGAGITGTMLLLKTALLPNKSGAGQTGWIQVIIEDQGIGIAEEFLERIFDPFFTTHKHEGGNGLGLAIVKQIIHRHSGMIEVTSGADKGTRFEIRLPNTTV